MPPFCHGRIRAAPLIEVSSNLVDVVTFPIDSQSQFLQPFRSPRFDLCSMNQLSDDGAGTKARFLRELSEFSLVLRLQPNGQE